MFTVAVVDIFIYMYEISIYLDCFIGAQGMHRLALGRFPALIMCWIDAPKNVHTRLARETCKMPALSMSIVHYMRYILYIPSLT